MSAGKPESVGSCKRRGGRERGEELTRHLRAPQRQVHTSAHLHKADRFPGILSLENLAGQVPSLCSMQGPLVAIPKNSLANISCPNHLGETASWSRPSRLGTVHIKVVQVNSRFNSVVNAFFTT